MGIAIFLNQLLTHLIYICIGCYLGALIEKLSFISIPLAVLSSIILISILITFKKSINQIPDIIENFISKIYDFWKK